MDFNERREALNKKHAEELTELEMEIAIASKLPVAPERIHAFKNAPWLVYKAGSLHEALEILRQYTLVEVQNIRDGCYYRYPEALHTENRKELPVDRTWTVEISQHIGKGFQSFSASAYAIVDGVGYVCIKIDFERPCFEGSTVRTAFFPGGCEKVLCVSFPVDRFGNTTKVLHSMPNLWYSSITKFGTEESFDFRFEYKTLEDFVAAVEKIEHLPQPDINPAQETP